MTNPKANDFSISKLLDRMHRSDVPNRSLLLIAYLVSFAWLLHRSGDVLSSAVGALFAAWLVVIPIAISCLVLFVAGLVILTVVEWFQATAAALRTPDPRAR